MLQLLEAADRALQADKATGATHARIVTLGTAAGRPMAIFGRWCGRARSQVLPSTGRERPRRR